MRTSAPLVTAGVERDHEVALLGAHPSASLETGPVEEVAGTPSDAAELDLKEVLEVGALGGRLGTLRPAGGGRSLHGRQALVEPGETIGDLGPELVERRVHPCRVEQGRQARGIAIEVTPEQLLHAADGAVAFRRVEELVDVALESAAISEEALQRARQATVAIGEVLAERLLQGASPRAR